MYQDWYTHKKNSSFIYNTDYFILKYNTVRVYSTKRTHSHTRAFSKAHLLLLLNPASVLGVASTTTSKLDSLTTCGVPWRLANRLVRAGDCDRRPPGDLDLWCAGDLDLRPFGDLERPRRFGVPNLPFGWIGICGWYNGISLLSWTVLERSEVRMCLTWLGVPTDLSVLGVRSSGKSRSKIA